MSQTISDDDGPPQGYQIVIPSDEARLVAAAIAGDSDAFTALVRMTETRVYALAYRLVGKNDADDVVQEAYLRAFKSLKRFRGDSTFSTWMFSITTNRAMTHLSRRSRFRHGNLSDDDNVLDERPESDPESMTEAGELRDRVTAALADLPPILRAVVVLRDVYDLPHDAIAKHLGITESAAKVRLHRARHKLRERLFPFGDAELARVVKEHAPTITEDHVSALPAKLQTVARLFYIDKLRAPDIARLLDMPRGTVSSRLERVKSLLPRFHQVKAERPEHNTKKPEG